MGIFSGGKGKNKSRSGSQYSQDVFAPQAEALTGLYKQAGNIAGQYNWQPTLDLSQKMQPWMFQQAQALQPAYRQQAAGGIRSPQLEKQLLANMRAPSNMSKMYASIVGGQGNNYVDPLINSLRNDMQYTADRQIGTNNDLQAATLGQSGSARHGVQNALTNRYANQDFQLMANQIRHQGYDKDMQMKIGIAQQADLGRLMSAQQGMDYLGGMNQNQQGAFGLGGHMQNLGMGAYAPMMQSYQMPWNMMNQYAGIIGSPFALSQGNSFGRSSGSMNQMSIF